MRQHSVLIGNSKAGSGTRGIEPRLDTLRRTPCIELYMLQGDSEAGQGHTSPTLTASSFKQCSAPRMSVAQESEQSSAHNERDGLL